MSTILEKIKEEVKTLTADELQQVRALVDSLLIGPAKPQMTEEEFARYLATKGVISLPEEATEDDDDDDWEPIEVSGQPLSEMIIEDRR
jgi:hypothetical protein